MKSVVISKDFGMNDRSMQVHAMPRSAMSLTVSSVSHERCRNSTVNGESLVALQKRT